MNALFVAWHASAPNYTWGPVGRLEFENGIYRFFYTKGAKMLPGFQPFMGMEDFDQVYESAQLFPLFENRLLASSRPEYEAFLTWSGFDPNHPPEPLVLLGVTEGIKQTDTVEVFPCPVPDGDGCYLNRFFLHGIHWCSPDAIDNINQLKKDEELTLVLEPENPVDQNAVAVHGRGQKIGYAPRYLARDIGELLVACPTQYIQLFVQRVNKSAPLQQRVLCRMHACWPTGFKVCLGKQFQPIPIGVSSTVAIT